MEVFALCISIISLGISFYGTVLDRPRLRFILTHYSAEQTLGFPYALVRVVNNGRRPIVIKGYGGDGSNPGQWGRYDLGDSGVGLRLAEKGFFEQKITPDDLRFDYHDEHFYFENLWFEDSNGKRYVIKHSDKTVLALLKENSELKRPKVLGGHGMDNL